MEEYLNKESGKKGMKVYVTRGSENKGNQTLFRPKNARMYLEKYVYRAVIDRVVDGDTVDAMIDLGFDTHIKRRIRLHGLDAWESRTRDLEEKEKGLAAKARTKELLYDISDKPQVCRVKSHGVGKYGRILGELFVRDADGNEININNTLVEEGHAYSYDGGKKKKFNDKK